MKRLMKSSLAIALALATGQVAALGLGPIQVKSGLNQPLVAEIPVSADSPAELNDLAVNLASTEDFQRVGLNRARVGVPIDFAVGSNGRGQTVIKLTTKDAVREPFLDFLIEVNWGKGKLLREYTVLLDPPVTAPAVVTTNKPAATVVTTPMAPPAPVVKPKPIEVKPAQAKPAVVAPSETVVAKPTPAPAAKAAAPPAAPAANAAGEYGPVEHGQTLSAIARELSDADGANVNQLMLALLKANPNAFYRDNINALKSGAVLRVPNADEIRAAAPLKEVAALVRTQNQSWSDASQPTLVTHTGAPAATETAAPVAKAAPPAKSEHLALVPPQSSKGSESGSDRAGSGKDGGDAARVELARTKETLANREQETSELRSRVKQLEDINDKGQHLLSLKDSEIAELQNKLKELQAAKAAASVAATAVKPAETTTAVSKPAAEPPAAASKPEPVVPPPVAATPAPPTSAPVISAAPAPTTTPAVVTQPVVTPPPSAAATPPVAPTVTPSSSSTAAQTKPLQSAEVKPAVPLRPKTSFFDTLGESPYLLYGLGAVLLLLGGWAWSRFLRKPKPVVRPQYAKTFERAPETAMPSHAVVPDSSDRDLLDRLAEHPNDVAVSLELLRHYYVQSDAPRFDALAETLHTHLREDTQEWQEVRAMGEGLSPDHPLFAEGAGDEHGYQFESVLAEPASHDDLQTQKLEFADFDEPSAESEHTHAGHDEDTLEQPRPFVHESDAFEPPHERAAFAFDSPAEGTAAGHETGLDEFLIDEDTIGTRLDLARAYLDMGDPDGARSMLDEVLAEGNETQKDEARKLLAELS
jgi:pilus assembly protein FimV